MKLPRMTETERAVFVAMYMRAIDRLRPDTDNSQADGALDEALHELGNFRQAIREREE